MSVTTRWIQRVMLATAVTGALGFGTAAAVFAAPAAQADPVFCGIRQSQDACRNCCLMAGYNDGGRWYPESGECWCANPD